MFYSPLRHSIYRSVWLVLFFSNICTWAHTITASILITKLTTSTILISLVQTAAALPVFLLAIPAGVFADLLDRKLIILIAQTVMAVIASIMAALAFAHLMTPYLLIGTTFLLNIGLALNQPAWQATSSTLVPQTEIKQAAALNNLSFNVSRCIGPAIAGYFFSKLGAGYLFTLNSISFLISIIVLSRYVPNKKISAPMTFKKFWRGSFDGLFLYRQYPHLKSIFLKAFLYFFFAASIWALLPYILMIQYKMTNSDLGTLTAIAGLGAVFNAYSIYYLRKKFTDTHLTTFTLLLASLVIYSIAHASTFFMFAIVLFVFGYSWSIAVSVFNGTLQADFPVEIRSRLIGIYCVFFAGAQVLGGYISGILVNQFGLHISLTTTALLTFIVFTGYLLITAKQQKQAMEVSI